MMTALSTTKTVPSSVTPSRKQPGGISNTFRWKGFDLYFLIQGVSGLDVFNGDGYYTESKKFNRNYVKDRWISAEYPGDGRTPTVGSAGISWEFTDYMIEDGSFVALRDVVLGYTFDKKKLKIKEAGLPPIVYEQIHGMQSDEGSGS